MNKKHYNFMMLFAWLQLVGGFICGGAGIPFSLANLGIMMLVALGVAIITAIIQRNQ